MTAAMWHSNQIITGPQIIGKKKLKMDSCLRGAILNLTAFCSIIEECGNNFQIVPVFDGH